MTLEEKIKEYAYRIGIDLIGFGSAKPFEELRGPIEQRKEKGYLTGFEEPDLEKRIDPQKTMENVKSIISVGMGYYTADKGVPQDESPYSGVIARSAWGRDYHEVMKAKLLDLMEYIRSQVGSFDYKIYVDTGPLSDRQVAYRAGIGWFGKNNMLISEKYGSWIFLGYALISLELKPDQPSKRNCEGCNRCIQACPGKALYEGYQMNGKNCLSYVTQMKEEVSEDLRAKLGQRVYGCDTCQNICPHNRQVKAMEWHGLWIDGTEGYPDLKRLMHLSKKEFEETYKKTAAGWRGKNLLRRNAIIAAGNRKDPIFLEDFVKLLKDDSSMIRKHAVWAIGAMDEKDGKEILLKHLEHEKDPEIQRLIQKLMEDR